MEYTKELTHIRNNLFYGSSKYTKNQPDLFMPHKFQMLAPSGMNIFFDLLKRNITEGEVLIYVHFPFCFTECLFCNSFPLKTDHKVQRDYIERLLKEIHMFSQQGVLAGKKVKCVYFGGGTPTSFSNNDLGRVMHALQTNFEFCEDCNITCEAHPSTLSEKKIYGIFKIGINRISIGCQTFDKKVLDFCNRKNTKLQIETIVKQANSFGIEVNIDMMTGLPGQTIKSVENDLSILEEIRPTSIEYIRHEIVNPLIANIYRLNKELVVGDDLLFEMVFITQRWMEHNSYEQNGRFTSSKQWSYRYYWLKEMPIIAFGPRTRSYTKEICYDKHEELSTYSSLIDKNISPIGRYLSLSKSDQMFRSLILSLQLKSGLDIDSFKSSYGEDPKEIFKDLVQTLSDNFCINTDENTIALSSLGSYFVEDVCDFIIDSALKWESGDFKRAPHSGGFGFDDLMYMK